VLVELLVLLVVPPGCVVLVLVELLVLEDVLDDVLVVVGCVALVLVVAPG
jgi:hypothetical protein